MRQRNSRNASPENLASTRNAGIAAASSTASAAGENPASSAARLTSEISCWPIENVLITIDSGRDDASRRALRKSVPLQELEPLSGLKGVQLISLANNVHGSQAGSLNALDLIDFSEDLIDLAETAALMLQLDLIITIDTSLAHLAGALGCKVWVPLCWDADWRWGVDDETSYWYPDVRLFRQTRPGDWKPVIKAIAKDLKAHAKAA